jgi:E3 ubiquitin-protein ligase DMA1/2
MDEAGTDLPTSRTTTILGSFLRGRPRNSSQSHIQLNTDIHNPTPDNSPLAHQQPPSQIPQSPRRRPGVPAALMTNHNSNNPTTGLGITSMLRRRRSAGNVSAQVPSPQPITTSATAAAALNLGTFISRPNPPPAAAATTAATTTNHGSSHLIRLVPHLDTRRSLRFDAISRDLKEGDPSLRIGRFTDRSGMGLAAVNALGSNKLAFKSKVVSRAHAEIWVESGGRFFVKDTKSSSGTFLNHVRLSVANAESRPFQIKDGDILQLGVDYQGGAEDIYKSVKIKIELGREWQASANAFKYVPFDFLLFSQLLSMVLVRML